MKRRSLWFNCEVVKPTSQLRRSDSDGSFVLGNRMAVLPRENWSFPNVLDNAFDLEYIFLGIDAINGK